MSGKLIITDPSRAAALAPHAPATGGAGEERRAPADVLRDAYDLAVSAGIVERAPLEGPLTAQRKALLAALTAAIEDPDRPLDAAAFAAVSALVNQSVRAEHARPTGDPGAAASVEKIPNGAVAPAQKQPAAIGSVLVSNRRPPWAGNYEGDFLADSAAAASFARDLEQVSGQSVRLPADLAARIQQLGPNALVPELGEVTRAMIARLETDPRIAARIDGDRALQALHTQTLNHLRHASFEFAREGDDYPHADVLPGAFPFRPVLKALLKALDFERFLATEVAPSFTAADVDPAAEQRFRDQERASIQGIVGDPIGAYQRLRDRLAERGVNASFPELSATVGYLELQLRSDPDVVRLATESPALGAFRAAVLEGLHEVTAGELPYQRTVDAIERAIELFDVVQREVHPEISPRLYHSERYEYYIHYLTAEAPEHINFPTIAALGSTDLLKTRGVPIGFWGVNTSVERVDGFHQTPYEFLIHDVNHDRRMYQFAKEEAARQGISVEELYRRSSAYVKDELLPLITPEKGDDEPTRRRKRLIKMILFEVLHEDALPADRSVIAKAMQRPPGELTPFERIDDGRRVVYFTEPGATTLAYVFRKLAHTFYDVPDDRKAYIVTEDLRTREAIIEAAQTLFRALGVEVPAQKLRDYVNTDEGLPDAFRHELNEDIYRLAGRFAGGVIRGTTAEDKLAAAEKLADLALMSGPYLAQGEREKLSEVARGIAGNIPKEARRLLRTLLDRLSQTEVAMPAIERGGLSERLAGIGIRETDGGRIGSATVHLLVHDLTLLPVDAIVVPQLADGASVGGVGDAIFKRGGQKGLRAFQRLVEERGRLEFGHVQLTESGSPRWPYLLNVASVHSGRDRELETVFTAAVNALKLAGEAGLTAVGLPALAQGIDGTLTPEQSARAILGALDHLAQIGAKIPDVVIATDRAEIHAAFMEALRTGSYRLHGGRLRPEPGRREFDLQRWAAGMNVQLANQEDFDASRAIAP